MIPSSLPRQAPCRTRTARNAIAAAPALWARIVVIQGRLVHEPRPLDHVDASSIRAAGGGVTLSLRAGVPQLLEPARRELRQLLDSMGFCSVPVRVLRAGQRS